MIRRLIHVSILGMFAAMILMLVPERAAAHVLITDTSHHTGAVLHISPDDDPIAGESAELYIDIQDRSLSPATHSFKLMVTDQHGTVSLVPIEPVANTISASYVFPTQGLYTLSLSLEPRKPSAESIHFVVSQRVARGTIATSSTPKTNSGHTWAIIGAISSSIALITLVVIASDNRTSIALRSRQSR